jgi:galactose-1-phosphate uridylyltransferase
MAVLKPMQNNTATVTRQRGQRKTSRPETEPTKEHLAWHDEHLLLCIGDHVVQSYTKTRQKSNLALKSKTKRTNHGDPERNGAARWDKSKKKMYSSRQTKAF